MKILVNFVVKNIELSASVPQWFKDMTKQQQKDYLEEHPNSKIAKQFNAEKNKPKTNTKPATKVVPKEKKDPYVGVPEEDKKVMIAAKERGFTVPPAWRSCWINPDPEGDLQVKGKDSKGRTQSLYSVNFRTKQDALKFERLKILQNEMPSIKAKLDKDLDKPEAQCLYLIQKTGFRIGSDKDTGAKVKAYGASTLTGKHITVKGDTISFDFIGKEGVHQQHTLEDKRLAKILKDKQGKDEKLFPVSGAKIHSYLDSISKNHYKVKDFRTHVATSTALAAMPNIDPPPPPKNKKEYEKAVMSVCKVVSAKLGNTPKMARDSYICPTVFKNWEFDLNKAQASVESEEQAMQDFIETNHFSYNKKLTDAYKRVHSLPKGEERKEAYRTFQTIAKKLGLVVTKDKGTYIKSLRQLELALKDK